MWLKVEETLCDHPKVIALSAALGLDKDAAAGKLLRLWTWALRHREDGFLKKEDASTIAEVMRFSNKPARLLRALVQSGLIDAVKGGYMIHDWTDYAGSYVEKRAAAAERKQRERLSKRMESARKAEEGQCRDACVTVTRPDADADADADEILTTTTADCAPARESEAFCEQSEGLEKLEAAYAQNIRSPSAAERARLAKWATELPEETIAFAVEQAALSGLRSFRGVETILNRWKREGVYDLPSAMAAQRAWESRAQARDAYAARAAPQKNGAKNAASNLDALLAQTLLEEGGPV